MCVYTNELPLLVAYPSPSDHFLYGVLVSMGITCKVIDVHTKEEHDLSHRDVIAFTWDKDYAQLRSRPDSETQLFLSGIIVRTTEGKVGILRRDLPETPQNANRIYVKYLGDLDATELCRTHIRAFIGHADVNLEYQ